MNEDCKNGCPYSDGLQKEITELKTELGKTKDKVDELEKSSIENRKDVDFIKTSISDIKDSIKTIANKLEELTKKPGNRWDKLVDYLIVAIASIAVSKFF
jgi:uncharacterized coiled-coil DUF342 family protein